MGVGIEAINFYGGRCSIDVRSIFVHRNLDLDRFDNLLINKKSVGLPCEDPITNAVNAAKPILDKMSQVDKDTINLLIVSSESGIDFGKSISTYVHDYLGLSRNCRLFEIKQACFGGTAALQTAINTVAAVGGKALVIASDVAKAMVKGSYAEPSQATGAVAMLISRNPQIFDIDLGAYGNCSYEVMDTCRPLPEIELGNADISLLSYLDCFETAYNNYTQKVSGVDFAKTFKHLAFHTPFPGMVKGAHRKMMRDLYKLSPKEIEDDFIKRVKPTFTYCSEVGNVYSATAYLALCSLIDHIPLDAPERIGIFSYGSGCSSEFYSGIITQNSKQAVKQMNIEEQLLSRYELNINEYEMLLDLDMEWTFGVENKKVDFSSFQDIFDKTFTSRNLLVLSEVKDFHRIYKWID